MGGERQSERYWRLDQLDWGSGTFICSDRKKMSSSAGANKKPAPAAEMVAEQGRRVVLNTTFLIETNRDAATSRILKSHWFHFLTAGEHLMLETLSGAEIHERLKEWWTAEGIVAGLVAGLSMTGLVDPPGNVADDALGGDSESGAQDAIEILSLLWMASTVLSLSAMLSTLFFYSSLNSLPSECGKPFVEKFMLWLPVPLVLLSIAVFNCFAAIAYHTYLVYGNSVLWNLFIVFLGIVPTIVQYTVLQRGQRSLALEHFSRGDETSVANIRI